MMLTASYREVCKGMLLVFFIVALSSCSNENTRQAKDCTPTPYDEMGPFYRPNAPLRSKVGTGYILSGIVKSARGCRPLSGARIEFWLVNEQGQYDDAHRATVVADGQGRYSFECNRPSDYYSRRPHIHMRVTSEGHEELVTQHYPEQGMREDTFDLVLPVREVNR